MDKNKLYKILDIEVPEEFKFYENISALFEETENIEMNLISNLLSEIDIEIFKDETETYFEEFLKNIPDDEDEIYTLVDSISRKILGYINSYLSNREGAELCLLSEELFKFRKWYVIDKLVLDKINNVMCSVCDARYGIVAANLLGEKYSYNFLQALEYEVDGFDVNLTDIVY